MDENGHNIGEQPRTKAKKAAYLEALKKALGVESTAMQKAGISSRETLRKWRKRDRKFAEAEKEAETYAGDFVETQLFRKIKEGDTKAIIFYCRTKLKNRGYTERTELTGADGKDLMPQKSDEDLIAEIRELQRKLEL